ncbi:hypothetical protein PINS_up003586 [Pythium insidiosum]|nr:hypothetical protein PINS_up003586 [Pythium insidiosum]
MHLLKRKQLLHKPSIYCRFFSSPSRGRCLLAQNGGYTGYTHELQNQWGDQFSFMTIVGPKLGSRAATVEDDGCGRSTWETETASFRHVIALINKMRPPFVVICGDFVDATPDNPEFDDQLDAFHDLLNEISPDTNLVFVPGGSGQRSAIPQSIYTAHFGSDQYSFWHGGVKFIVMNSALFMTGNEQSDAAARQRDWLARELDNGKICARETVLFAAHSFYSLQQGPELPLHLQKRATNQPLAETISEETRKEIRDIINKNAPRLIFTTEGTTDRVCVVHTTRLSSADDDEGAIKKTEMVICSPVSTGSSAVVGKVVQSGITIERVKVGSQELSGTTPEKSDQILSADTVDISVS